MPSQSRQQIFELREFDLQLSGDAVRPLREDVEDDLAAVEHLHHGLVARPEADHLLQVALLPRGERVVEDHDVGAVFLDQRPDLFRLACADERPHVGDGSSL